VLTAVGALGIATPDQMEGSDAPLATALDEGAGITWAAGILALLWLVGVFALVAGIVLAVLAFRIRALARS